MDHRRIQRTGETAPSPVAYTPADHLLVELEDFADAASEGRKPEVDGQDGLFPLAVVLAAAKSSNERRSVPLAEILGDD